VAASGGQRYGLPAYGRKSSTKIAQHAAVIQQYGLTQRNPACAQDTASDSSPCSARCCTAQASYGVGIPIDNSAGYCIHAVAVRSGEASVCQSLRQLQCRAADTERCRKHGHVLYVSLRRLAVTGVQVRALGYRLRRRRITEALWSPSPRQVSDSNNPPLVGPIRATRLDQQSPQPSATSGNSA
jgi:hypothetical protein